MPSLFLVLEDNPEMAENNCRFLQQIEPEARCLWESKPEAVTSRLAMEQPDLLVIDLLFGDTQGHLSAQPGLDCLADICERYQHLNVLVYTAEPTFLNPLVARIQHHRGGLVVVNKLERRDVFVSGAKSALEGKHMLPRELNQVKSLTDIEQQVLKLMCVDCLADRAIAERMHIALRTAQNHIRSLKQKLAPEALDDDEKNARMAVCHVAYRDRWLV